MFLNVNGRLLYFLCRRALGRCINLNRCFSIYFLLQGLFLLSDLHNCSYYRHRQWRGFLVKSIKTMLCWTKEIKSKTFRFESTFFLVLYVVYCVAMAFNSR